MSEFLGSLAIIMIVMGLIKIAVALIVKVVKRKEER
jgi:hypothetical protein